jgi:hypothetical protein
MFVIVVFLLQLAIGVLTEGIFDPSGFSEAGCTGSNQWTMWFDSNNPSLALGEFEITNHIQQIYASFMCPIPTAIEVIIFYIYFFLLLIEKKIFLYSRLVQ